MQFYGASNNILMPDINFYFLQIRNRGLGAFRQSSAVGAPPSRLQSHQRAQGHLVPGPRVLGHHEVLQLEEDVRICAAEERVHAGWRGGHVD